MLTKRAAELRRGDAVVIGPGDRRVVEQVSFRGKPIDLLGTGAVEIRWVGRTKSSIVAVDKDMTVEDRGFRRVVAANEGAAARRTEPRRKGQAMLETYLGADGVD